MKISLVVKPILYLAIVIVVLSLWGFYSAIRPPLRIHTPITPRDLGLPYEKISFVTEDQVKLSGWFIPNKNPRAKTIILLHGYPADKGNILPSTYFLHKDYHLLYFDFRYLGESGGSYSTVGKHEVYDLLAAINYLKSRGINEVGVWGFSLGGAVAIMTAPNAPAIRAIVSQSSYASLELLLPSYYRLPLLGYPLSILTKFWASLFLDINIDEISPENAAMSLKTPILVIHSEQDDQIPFFHAKQLEQALLHNPNASFLFIKDTRHGDISIEELKTVEKFFNKHFSP